MALNIKNPRVEQLASEVASMAGESKTEAIRRALEERKRKLELGMPGDDRLADVTEFLEREVWPFVPRRPAGEEIVQKAGGQDSGIWARRVLIIDSSAVVAIFFKEPAYEVLQEKMAAASVLGMGTPTLVETGVVLSARLRSDARGPLERFLQINDVSAVDFGESHWRQALQAFDRFGRGRHPAKLNLGDCMSYATAKLASQPLLCVGGDFPLTDLEVA